MEQSVCWKGWVKDNYRCSGPWAELLFRERKDNLRWGRARLSHQTEAETPDVLE